MQEEERGGGERSQSEVGAGTVSQAKPLPLRAPSAQRVEEGKGWSGTYCRGKGHTWQRNTADLTAKRSCHCHTGRCKHSREAHQEEGEARPSTQVFTWKLFSPAGESRLGLQEEVPAGAASVGLQYTHPSEGGICSRQSPELQ